MRYAATQNCGLIDTSVWKHPARYNVCDVTIYLRSGVRYMPLLNVIERCSLVALVVAGRREKERKRVTERERERGGGRVREKE